MLKEIKRCLNAESGAKCIIYNKDNLTTAKEGRNLHPAHKQACNNTGLRRLPVAAHLRSPRPRAGCPGLVPGLLRHHQPPCTATSPNPHTWASGPPASPWARAERASRPTLTPSFPKRGRRRAGSVGSPIPSRILADILSCKEISAHPP